MTQTPNRTAGTEERVFQWIGNEDARGLTDDDTHSAITAVDPPREILPLQLRWCLRSFRCTTPSCDFLEVRLSVHPMALNDLSNSELLSFTTQWTAQTDLFLSMPRLAVYVDDIATTNHELTELSSEGPSLASLRAESKETDNHHDDIFGGGYDLLRALARLSRTPELRAHYTHLADKILPEGKGVTNATYAEQAGASVLLAGRLDAETRAALAAIPTTEGRTMEVEVDDGMQSAARLIELETARQGLMGKSADDKISKQERARRRANFFALLSEIEAALKRSHASEEVTAKILGPVRAAARKATKPSGSPTPPVPPG